MSCHIRAGRCPMVAYAGCGSEFEHPAASASMDAAAQPQTNTLPTLLKFRKMSSLVNSLTSTTECDLVLCDLVVTHTEHACKNFRPSRATLFLHEHLVARTLQFERELKDWRLAEIQAGRRDPGRPVSS